jgi:hypothetical protein
MTETAYRSLHAPTHEYIAAFASGLNPYKGVALEKASIQSAANHRPDAVGGLGAFGGGH